MANGTGNSGVRKQHRGKNGAQNRDDGHGAPSGDRTERGEKQHNDTNKSHSKSKPRTGSRDQAHDDRGRGTVRGNSRNADRADGDYDGQRRTPAGARRTERYDHSPSRRDDRNRDNGSGSGTQHGARSGSDRNERPVRENKSHAKSKPRTDSGDHAHENSGAHKPGTARVDNDQGGKARPRRRGDKRPAGQHNPPRDQQGTHERRDRNGDRQPGSHRTRPDSHIRESDERSAARVEHTAVGDTNHRPRSEQKRASRRNGDDGASRAVVAGSNPALAEVGRIMTDPRTGTAITSPAEPASVDAATASVVETPLPEDQSRRGPSLVDGTDTPHSAASVTAPESTAAGKPRKVAPGGEPRTAAPAAPAAPAAESDPILDADSAADKRNPALDNTSTQAPSGSMSDDAAPRSEPTPTTAPVKSSATDKPEKVAPDGEPRTIEATASASGDRTLESDAAVDEGNPLADRNPTQPSAASTPVETAPTSEPAPATAPGESRATGQPAKITVGDKPQTTESTAASPTVKADPVRVLVRTGAAAGNAPIEDAEAPQPLPEPAPGSAADTTEPAPEGTPTASSACDAPEKLTIEQVDAFADFIRFLAELDGDLKPIELKKNSTARVAVAKPTNLAQFDEQIGAIAARDTKLATALSLILTADKSDLSGLARQNITELAARVLGKHPAFVDDAAVKDRLARLLAGDAEADILPKLIVRLRNLLDGAFEGKSSLKTPALQSLQENATHTAVLIAASAAKWDVASCIDALADNVWGTDAPYATAAVHREKLATLPKGARKAVTLIVDTARTRLRGVEEERDVAISRVESGLADVQRLSEQLASARRHTEELETEMVSVRSELQREVDARRSERMGSTTDFETLRVDTARVIADQIESLEDALDALGHGQSQITDEFVRRSVHNLRRSLSTLQPRTKQNTQGDTP